MDTGHGSQSYDDVADIGELYDHVGLYARREADVRFYVDRAREARGDVLEVGCGTGRVLIPTARAGIPIVGLDQSEGMLARCREKVARESAEVRSRIELRAADMRDFELQRRFALITAPFRSFQHLITDADRSAFLAAARRHLRSGGRFVFDVFNPDPAKLVAPSVEEREDTPLTPLPANRRFRRTARVTSIDHDAGVSRVELTYYVSDAAGPEDRRVQAFSMRWYRPDQLEQILLQSGFRVCEMYGDFDRAPIGDGTPEIIAIAEGAGD